MASDRSTSTQRLIVSESKNPKVNLKPGMKLDVRTVSLVDANLKKPTKLAARLCGGTSTCLALIELPKQDDMA